MGVHQFCSYVLWVLVLGQVVARGILKSGLSKGVLTLDLMDRQWEPYWPKRVKVREREFAYRLQPKAYARLGRSLRADMLSAEQCARFLASLPSVGRSSIRYGRAGLRPAVSRQKNVEEGYSNPPCQTGIHKISIEELDMITTHAVVTDKIQDIKATPEPNLSRVSKSLKRKDVLKIFYSRNKWRVTVKNYNYHDLFPMAGLNVNYGPVQIDIHHDLTDHHDYLRPRLLNWLELSFRNRVLGLDSWKGKTRYEWHIRADRLAKLFAFSRFLRDDRKMEWQIARLYLEWFIKVAGVCNEPGSELLDYE